MGAEVIITVKGTPFELIEPSPIATAPNGTPTQWPFPCGRPSTSQGIDRLKEFIAKLLTQLRKDLAAIELSPSVFYIELWNEPDAPTDILDPDFYGCWVNPYYPYNATAVPSRVATSFAEGGIYYAQVLNTIAPYVKSHFPAGSIKFVAGAVAGRKNGFLTTVIDNAIANIDVVSYHHYAYGYNSTCDLAAVIADYDTDFNMIRNYLDGHGGAEIPILISEGAMRYYSPATPVPTPTPAPAFYDCQADFAANLLGWAESKRNSGKLLGFIWYTIATNGWAETDLLYNNGTPKPVYYVWRDYGPSIYLPIVRKDTGSLQNISLESTPASESAKPEDPYPPPAPSPVPYPAP